MLKFAKVRESAIIPSKKVEDAGYDIYANFEDDFLVIQPNEIKMIPTGIASAFSYEFVMVLKERGSSGSKGLSVRCGIIDSGYRNEWFVPINNTSNKPIVIAKEYVESYKTIEFATVYPYNKAICQALLLPVPKVEVAEISYDELKKIKSERGEGCLGSSNK